MPGYVLHALYIRIPLNSYNSTKGQVLLSSLIFQVKNLRHIEVKKHTKVAQVTSGRARFKPRQVCPRAQILSTIMLLQEDNGHGRKVGSQACGDGLESLVAQGKDETSRFHSIFP